MFGFSACSVLHRLSSLVGIIQRFQQGDYIVNLGRRPQRWLARLAVRGQRYRVDVFASCCCLVARGSSAAG
jgi:hypothetical protein